jgi:hypothetical protein
MFIPHNLLERGARTTTGNSQSLDVLTLPCTVETMDLELEVYAASGTTPTLNVKLQDSHDGVDFNDVAGATFAQQTAAARVSLDVNAPTARYLRISYTIAGTTPSFDFDVKSAIHGNRR